MEGSDNIDAWMYHDIKRVEHILKHGFDRQKLAMDIKMLCMYYRDVLGYKPKQRKDALEAFCKEHIAGYNEVLYFRVIDSALNFAKRKNTRLVEIEKVDIYKSEIDYINSLPVETNFKRILFSLLVSVKLHKMMLATIYTTYKQGYYTSTRLKDSDIFKIAHTTTKTTKKYYFHILEIIGYITTLKSGAMRINIFNNMPIDTSEVAIEVKRFMYTGFYFDAYNNTKGIMYCEKCGVPLRRRCSSQMRCPECAQREPAQPREFICPDCGETYYSFSGSVLRCPECAAKHRKELKRVLSREGMRRYRARKRLENQ